MMMTERSGDRDRIKGGVDETKGRVKEAWGDLTGDDRAKAEGIGNQVKGRAEQTWGDIKDAADDITEDVERATR
jgi:uncharacterized protein YjbJ (UPF0337 family)